ncbi:hypothetical protein AB205_0179230 [Aquarana catesbeiana]|uniref:Uncharacterized protein n=1 Tax=Aquarana catesbeiana TaxID=8400 RepID=A0A2G9RSS7_AQUCT|nr:hypothetical protein AB205_0179230 [Aquarana catesbeiana]
MFHIPISGLKYLCAKYTFCFILIGEKRLGGHHSSEDTRAPPTHQEGEISPRPPRIWRKERCRKLVRLTPKQVMYWLWNSKLNLSLVTAPKGSSTTS